MSETTADEHAEGAGRLLHDWIGRAEFATELGLSVDTLGRWETRRMGPPCIRLGRRVLYRRDAVREWLVEQEPARGPRK